MITSLDRLRAMSHRRDYELESFYVTLLAMKLILDFMLYVS